MTEREIELQAKLEQAERERDEAQRAKYGTPCRCALWIEVSGVAEERAEAAESALAAAQGALREVEREIGAAKRVAMAVGMAGGFYVTPDSENRIRAALAAESGKPGGAAPAPEEWSETIDLRGMTQDEADAALVAAQKRRSGALSAEPRAAPPALPAELSGKGEQRAYSHEHVFDTQLLCKVCGGCALDLAEEAAEPGEAKKEEP